MFTGLVETVGTIAGKVERRNYLVLTINAPNVTDCMKTGDSIACDGACLTVVSNTTDSFTVEVSQETVSKTIVGSYQEGDKVNLERPLRVGDRLGGHYVLGHVDDVGTVQNVMTLGESTVVSVRYDESFDRLVVQKGSITINGVSLTINDLKSGWCSVNLIPHTMSATNLGSLGSGSKVNLEFDIIGKYATNAAGVKQGSRLTIAKLTESGW